MLQIVDIIEMIFEAWKGISLTVRDAFFVFGKLHSEIKDLWMDTIITPEFTFYKKRILT